MPRGEVREVKTKRECQKAEFEKGAKKSIFNHFYWLTLRDRTIALN